MGTTVDLFDHLDNNAARWILYTYGHGPQNALFQDYARVTHGIAMHCVQHVLYDIRFAH